MTDHLYADNTSLVYYCSHKLGEKLLLYNVNGFLYGVLMDHLLQSWNSLHYDIQGIAKIKSFE